jgi:exodeoxyribonuclease-3
MKIASWNVNSLNVRLPHLEQWLKDFGPDIVGIQETKLEDHKFPDSALIAAGYRSVFAGQKTYNGVALLSREPAQDVQIGIPGFEDEQKRVIAGTFGDLRVINLYVVNGQDIGTDKYEYKLRWLEAVHAWIAAELQRHPKLIVMGDFNIAPDARDVHDPEVWNDNHILTSTAERGALQQAAAAGPARWLPPAQRRGRCVQLVGLPRRRLPPQPGLRIDLTLVSDALKGGAVASGIDREPRTWERATMRRRGCRSVEQPGPDDCRPF